MTPDDTLAAVETIIDSFLVVCRDDSPPAHVQKSSYRYQSPEAYASPGLMQPWTSPIAANSVSPADVYRTQSQSLLMKMLRKSLTITLFSHFHRSQYVQQKGAIGEIVDDICHTLCDWWTMRVIGRIGVYYAADGLKLRLVEELPPVSQMLERVLAFLTSAHGRASFSLQIPVESTETFEGGDYRQVEILRDAIIDQNLSGDIAEPMQLRIVDKDEPKDWGTTDVWVPIMSEDPESQVHRRVGWARLPIRCVASLYSSILPAAAPETAGPTEPAEPEPVQPASPPPQSNPIEDF